MIYTIGHAENYRTYIAKKKETDGFAIKIGPRKNLEYNDADGNLVSEPYGGGIAFETPIDALVFNLISNHDSYSVFALDGEWNSDVKFDDENKFYRIVKDLKILEEVVI